MRISTMTTLFRECRENGEHIGYLESMRRCREAGFRVLDFNMCSSIRRSTELTGDDWQHSISVIRDEAEKLGIEFSQSHPPYRPFKGSHFSSLEDEERFNELTRRAIIASGMLGVKWAVMHPVSETVAAEYNDEADLLANHQVFDSVLELAKKENVGLAFENMCDKDNRRRFGATAEELLQLCHSYSDPHVGVCWDAGHGQRVYTDQTAALQKLGKYIKATHIDDNFGEADLHLLPFLGNVKWESIMKTLQKIDYRGDLTYEITINHHMPEDLKDATAIFAFRVGEYLLSLADK